MSETEQSRIALKSLEAGDFAQARAKYGELVELLPEDIEYQCGLYTAGFWHNREDSFRDIKSGRNLGAYLMREWEKFQEIAEARDYTGCLTFQTAMQRVLGDAAIQYRIAFQEEGGHSIDEALLLDLSKCLIKVQDYRNAVDILHYARRILKDNPFVLFLLGESLCSLPQEESHLQGLAFYRDAFILNPTCVDPTLIASSLISEVFERIYEELDQDLEAVLLWLPAYVHAAGFQSGLKAPTPDKLEYVNAEIIRLNESLLSVVDKYKSKVRAQLAFYYIIMLHYYTFPSKQYGLIEDYESDLRELSPEVYSAYKKSVNP